jgi:HEAT repeat protein
MLDDEAIRSREAIFHRLISVLGELSVKRSVAPLAAILTDRSVGNLTKAYAANALGRIGEAAGVEALVASLNVKDEMVRRQVAMALGRIDREAGSSTFDQIAGRQIDCGRRGRNAGAS